MFLPVGLALFFTFSQIFCTELEPRRTCAQLLTMENPASAGDRMLIEACDLLHVADFLRNVIDNFEDSASAFLSEQGVVTTEPTTDAMSEMEKRKHEYLRFGKRKHEYLRFGKRKHEYLRFGKRKHEYLRFG